MQLQLSHCFPKTEYDEHVCRAMFTYRKWAEFIQLSQRLHYRKDCLYAFMNLWLRKCFREISWNVAAQHIYRSIFHSKVAVSKYDNPLSVYSLSRAIQDEETGIFDLSVEGCMPCAFQVNDVTLWLWRRLIWCTRFVSLENICECECLFKRRVFAWGWL